jgi:flagellin FlaB
MMKIFNTFLKDDKAFTGLEAAIVLTAFVVVAAVFSYVVLGAGFFTTEKSKEVIHTGVEQATSSAELVGDVIGQKTTGANITHINFTIQLTAGNNPLDLNESTISYTTSDLHNSSVTWGYTMYSADGDNMLERNEKAEIQVTVPDDQLGPYVEFKLEFKPGVGGTLPISRTAPGSLTEITRLY